MARKKKVRGEVIERVAEEEQKRAVENVVAEGELVSPKREVEKEVKYHISGKVNSIITTPSYLELLVSYKIKDLETGEERTFNDWVFLPQYWASRQILAESIIRDLAMMRVKGEYEPHALEGYEFEIEV